VFTINSRWGIASELRSSETVESLSGADEDFSGGEGWGGEDLFLKIIQLN
jgi:hypothetical protein